MAALQNGTGGRVKVTVSGLARARADAALRQPSQPVRPGRRRHRFSSPLQRP
jgi:hypothetical protein